MSFRGDFFSMASGRAVYLVSQWALIVLIARTTTPETLGAFTYALALATPVIVFAKLNMRAYIATDVNEEIPFQDYLTATLLMMSLAVACLWAIAIVDELATQTVMLTVAVGVYKAMEGISDVFYGELQRRETMRRIGYSIAFHGVVAFLVMALVLQLTGSVFIGAVGIGVSWLLTLLMYDAPRGELWACIRGFSGLLAVWRVVRTCFPLGLVLGLLSLRLSVPAYFVKAHMGTDQVGYYAAVSYFTVAGNLAIGSLVQTAAPRFSRLYAAGQSRDFKSLLAKLILFSLCAGVAGMTVAALWGDLILATMYGQDFARYANALMWVMAAAGIGYVSQLIGSTLTVARLFRYQIATNVLGVLAVLTASYVFVPIRGIEGAALALVFGAFVVLLANATIAWARLNLNGRLKPGIAMTIEPGE